MALKPISEDLIKIVNAPLDKSLIRVNYSKEKYITGYTVVRLLNQLTNCAWDFTIDKTWQEKCSDSRGDHDIYHMTVTLNCYFTDDIGEIIKISKPGTAGKTLEAGAKNATNIYKSLETLALRKAASYFGIGAELWLNEDEVDYFGAQDAEPLWTDELMQQYADRFEKISSIQEEFGLKDHEIDDIVADWNNNYAGLADVPPEDIDMFVDYLELQIQEEASS